jgi:tetratricopeptide (TPR) repeat protein
MGPRLSLRSSACLALLLTGLASRSAAQKVTAKEQDYWKAVDEYIKGDRHKALEMIGAWNAKDLGSVLNSIEDAAKAAAKCRACDAGQRFGTLPIKAAILLHAQRDRADRVAKVKVLDGAAECSESTHGQASERLLASALVQAGGEEFVARFSLAMALDFRAMLCFLRAVHWAEVGLKTAPGDPTLFVARGLASETMGVTGWAEPTPFTTFDDRRGRRTVLRSGPIDKTRQLNLAREAFEKALTLDTDQEEARVRLGRVLWHLGRTKEAEEALRKAVAANEGPVSYLAHLFLGRCLEDRQDLEGAIQEYKASLILRPETQIGAVALAHALVLRGDAEGARQVLEPALAYSGNHRTMDPYWLYLVGAPELSEALIEALRMEAAR